MTKRSVRLTIAHLGKGLSSVELDEVVTVSDENDQTISEFCSNPFIKALVESLLRRGATEK